jgi:hypothetical protein
VDGSTDVPPPRLALATCAEVGDLDPEGRLLLAACREAGIEAEPAIWDDGSIDWDGFDLVLIRSTWDYKDKPAEFRAWTERIGPRLRNAPAIVTWNLSKHYLQVLRGWGFPVVPTEFLEPGACREQIAGTLPGSGEYVVKPAVSAGSTDTARYVAAEPGDRERALEHANDLLGDGRTVMVQPFLSSVETEAETAVILLAGEPVHAIRKGPLLEIGQGLEPGLFREEDISLRQPHQDELRLAQAVVERFSAEVAPPLYARVDMLRDEAGKPTVLELELIEPSLTLDYSPSSLARMVELVGAELDAGA